MRQPLTTNTLWLLFCTDLVFMMSAGFRRLESSLFRSKNKNSTDVAIKHIVGFCIVSGLFRLFGCLPHRV